MSDFDQNQVQNLKSSLSFIKTLKDDEKQKELRNLIKKAQLIFGTDSPYMAILHYEYGSLVLSKIINRIELFNPDAQPQQPIDFLFDENRTKEKNTQAKDNLTQIQSIDAKINPELPKNKKQFQKDQSDSQHQKDLTNIEVCYENFQAALNIYDRELKKIEDGEESPLDRTEATKYKFHIHGRLGELYSMDQKYDESIEEFRTVVKLASDFDHPETLRIISEAHFSIGNALLHQNNSSCEELAIQEYIWAVECLIRYMNEVERYDTEKFEVPSLENSRVDRYHYLNGPKDSEMIAQLKDTISFILDKIEETSEKRSEKVLKQLRIQRKQTENQQLQVKEVQNDVNAMKSETFKSRKRMPSDVQISQEQMERMRVGLNQVAPSQMLINLVDSEQVETNVNQDENQLLESFVKPVFSPCGNYYASFNNGSAEVRDASKQMIGLIAKVQLRQKAYKGFSSNPINTNIRFSPDSRFFAVLKGKVLLIYSIEGKLRMRISDLFIEQKKQKLDHQKRFRRDIKDFFWSQNPNCPQIIVQFTQADFYRVYNIDSRDVQQINYVIDGMQKNHVFSKGPDTNLFAVVSKPNQKKHKCIEICLFMTNHFQWRFKGYYEIPTVYIDKVELSPNNEFLILFPASRLKVQLYNLLTKQFTTLIQDDYLMLSGYKMSNSGEYLAIGTNNGKLLVFQTFKWLKILEVRLEPKVNLGQNFIVHNEENGHFKVQNKGVSKLPYYNPIDGYPPLFNSIAKIQFSPNQQFLAVKSTEMPHSIFIYCLNNQRTIIISTSNKVKDFKWLRVKEGPSTLCIALKKNGITLWKSTCPEGQLFQEVIPENQSGEIKITDIQTGKNGDMILYAKEQKKFVYCCFDPSLFEQQERKDIEI